MMAGYGGRSYASAGYAGSASTDDETPHYGGINFGDEDEWGGSGRPSRWRPILELGPGVAEFPQSATAIINPRVELITTWASVSYAPEDVTLERSDLLQISWTESTSKQEWIQPESIELMDVYVEEGVSAVVPTDFQFPTATEQLGVAFQEAGQVQLLTPVDVVDQFDLALVESATAALVVDSQGDTLDLSVTESPGSTEDLSGYTPIGWIGGSGSSGGSGGSSDPTYQPPSYSETVGDGTTTEFVVEHGLPGDDLIVVAYDTATGERINVTYEVRSDGTVVTTFASAPSSDGARIVVLASAASVGGGGTGTVPGSSYPQEGKDPRVRSFYESPKQMSMQELSETGLVYPIKLPYETTLYEVDPWLEGRGGGDLCNFGWFPDTNVSPVGEINNGMVDDSAIVLNDGRVLYVYTDYAGRVMGGYVEDSWKFLTQSYTTEDDFVIFDGLAINTSRGGTAPGATISKAGNPERLFLTTAWQEASSPPVFKTQVWTSLDEGRTWELRQTLSQHNYDWEEGTTQQYEFDASNVTSTVATMPNGRLVVVGPWWVTMGLKAAGHVLGGQVWGVWTSDDNGDTWTWRTYWGHGPIIPLIGWIPLYVNTFSRSMAYLDGYMYCVTQSDYNSWHMHMWRSSDGINWGSPSDGTRTRGGWLYNLAAGWHTWSQPEATGFLFSATNLALWQQGDCLYLFSSRHPRSSAWHFDWDTMRYTDPYPINNDAINAFDYAWSKDVTKTGAILETQDPGNIQAWKKVEEIPWDQSMGHVPEYRWPGQGPLRPMSGRPIFQRLEKNYAMVGTNGRILGILLEMPGEYEGVIKPERIIYR